MTTSDKVFWCLKGLFVLVIVWVVGNGIIRGFAKEAAERREAIRHIVRTELCGPGYFVTSNPDAGTWSCCRSDGCAEWTP